MKVKNIIILHLTLTCMFLSTSYASQSLAPFSWIDKNLLKNYIVIQMKGIVKELSMVSNAKERKAKERFQRKKSSSSTPRMITIYGNSNLSIAGTGGFLVVPSVTKAGSVNAESVSYVPIEDAKSESFIAVKSDSVTLEFADLFSKIDQLWQNIDKTFHFASQKLWEEQLLAAILELEKGYVADKNLYKKSNPYRVYLSQSTTQERLIVIAILDFLKKSIQAQSLRYLDLMDVIQRSA